jgi:signal transduction histidine kinase
MALGMPGVTVWSWDICTGWVDSTVAAEPCNFDEFAALVDEKYREAWRTAFERARDHGAPWVSSFHLALSSGAESRCVEERGRAWLDDDGRPARAVALRVEVPCTHRQAEDPDRASDDAATQCQAEAALGLATHGFLDSAFESSPNGVLLLAADGRIVRTNRRARELLRCGESPPGRMDDIPACIHVLDARGDPVPRERLPSALALRGDATHGMALWLQFPDGQKVGVLAGATPIRARDGALEGVVVEVAEAVTFFDLQEPRADLVRLISQDLRRPLGAILVQAKLLRRRNEAAQAVRSRAEAIVASAQLMAAVLNDLVESILLEEGRLRLELESVDLVAMVNEVRERLPADCGAGRVRIEPCRGLPRVVVDPGRLERVVVSLLTGALQRSPPGAAVTVRAAPDAGQVVLEIQDEGQRIEAATLAHAFERRQPPSTSGLDATSLALYTSRVLVEAHGGSMTANADGRGNVIRVRLPQRSPEQA